MLQQVKNTDQDVVKHPNGNARAKGLRTEVVTVTPDMAERWLGKSINNRGISKRLVAAYARDMAAGHWRLTGEPLGFDEAGHFVNGHHRLKACIRAGTPFTSTVVRGLSANAIRVMDAGRARRAHDILKMDGADYSVRMAAAANWLMCIKAGSSRGAQFTRSETLACIEKHPKLLDACEAIGTLLKPGFIGPFPTLLIALHYIGAYLLKEPDAAAKFARVFETGEPSYPNDAAHAWRERLIRMKTAGLRPPREVQMPALIYAWNLFRARKAAGEFEVPDKAQMDGLNYKRL